MKKIPRSPLLIVFAMSLPLLLSRAVHAQDILPLDKITNQAELDKTTTALDAALFDSNNR